MPAAWTTLPAAGASSATSTPRKNDIDDLRDRLGGPFTVIAISPVVAAMPPIAACFDDQVSQ
jgi:hypothetical protein